MNFYDRIKGAFIALAVGDALGAPHEFRYSLALTKYTGKLIYQTELKSRFQGSRKAVVGQITDDTSMSVALLETIVRNQDWLEDQVITAYLKWANSGHSFLGRNTRALFKGIKTLKGYRNRYAKRDLSEMQSNGSLMRALPLVTLFRYHRLVELPTRVIDLAIKDTQLTNPSPVNVDAIRIYMTIAYKILNKIPIEQFITKLSPETKPIQQAVDQALKKQPRDVTILKGWVAHPIYLIVLALKTIIHKKITGALYPILIDWVIRLGGDTDTNAAIVGGILGLYLGYSKLISHPTTHYNVKQVLAADPSQGQLPIAPTYLPTTGLKYIESFK